MNYNKIKIHIPKYLFITLFSIYNLLNPGIISASDSFKLTILHTNDSHGHPAPFTYQNKKDAGGIPARYTLIKEIKNKYENVIVLDAGDVNSGLAISNLFFAEPDFILMREAGYDAMVVGNHEFDYPLSVIREQEKWFGKSFLSANIVDNTGKPVFQPYIIINIKGTTVGILGLTTEFTNQIGNPKYVKDVSFLNPIETAKKYIKEMQEKTNIIIVLSHLGFRSFGQDRITSEELALKVDNIDVIIDGHTNEIYEKPFKTGNAILHCARKFGLYLGKVDLEFVNGNVVNFSGETIPINLDTTKIIPQDPTLSKLLEPYITKSIDLMGEKIGEAVGSFPLRRYEGSALFNLITDVIKQYTNTDVVIQNVGGVREGFEKGPITRGDINSVIPFQNEIIIAEITGNELLEILKFVVTQYKVNSFAQFSGLRWTIDVNSKEILELSINGQPVSPDKIYKIATLDYLVEGGDGYKFFKNSNNHNLYETGLFSRELLMQYIIEKKIISPTLDERFKF